MQINHEKTTHAFTQSGLGFAPFKFLRVEELFMKLPDGNTRASGGCDHCGTNIRWAFVIKSSCGKTSKVGSDCIDKAGDKGLIDIAKAERNRRAREARHAKQEAARQEELQRQRDRNGGKTNWEIEQEEWKAELDRRQAIKDARFEAFEPFIDQLIAVKKSPVGFIADMIDIMTAGDTLTRGQLHIVAEILAKREGRKGSKAFNAAFPGIKEALETING